MELGSLKIIAILLLNSALVNCKFCGQKVRVKIEDADATFSSNGSILHKNMVYPKGTFWKYGENIYGCPCKVKHCLRMCLGEEAKAKNMSWSTEDLKLNILHNDRNKMVNLHDHFFLMEEAVCSAFHLLDPETDDHHVLANGSLLVTEHGEVHDMETFCLAKNKENGELQVNLCFTEEEIKTSDSSDPRSIQFILYPLFMIISMVFLCLTLIAFCVSPEMHNLQGKSIACQSGTLIIAFIGFIVTHLYGSDSEIEVCKTFAYISYTFMLSSFFWLNTMCFDIFWTFSNLKKMTSSLNQTHKKKFKMYAMYSTINPLILSVTVIALDNALDARYSLWPGIGYYSCWFKNRTTEFLYYQGPLMFLLIGNFSFFAITLYRISKMKSDSKVLKRGDSRTHNSACGEMEDRHEKLSLYIKLFLLMGGTWLMETLSWLIKGPTWVWIIPDIINCSRGVLIFVFCVWSNQKVRKSLVGRVFSSHDVNRESMRSSRSNNSTKETSGFLEGSEAVNGASMMRQDSDEGETPV